MNSGETLIRIVLLSLLLYAGASLASSARELAAAEAREACLSVQLEELQRDNLRMTAEVDGALSPCELEQLARRRLGLVLPGEKIFYFTTDREG